MSKATRSCGCATSDDVLRRAAALIAGVWAGLLATVGFVAAPVAFALLARPVAGLLAGRLFLIEAYAGLAAAMTLLLLIRRRASGRDPALWLTLGALFCTVAGDFALQPMMEAARAGQGALSFGALHGISAVFYGVKTLLVLALAWRLTESNR